jgi:glycosyltransferase involved in cell wall biosynthesis
MKDWRTIAIFTGKVQGLPPWDPDSIRSGITGSEEAVIYISQQLAELGFKVFVLGDPPPQSAHSDPQANPRFLSIDHARFHTKVDIVIAWRMPTIGAQLKTFAQKVYLWPHDTLNQHLTKEQILAFDDVLWLSKWQRDQWVSVNPHFAKFKKVFGNGINQEQFQPIQERANPYSCIYGSNYARGLDVLLDLWPHIKKRQPRATLDIYYGWQHWGLLSDEKETAMRKKIAVLPDVFDHGLVSHEELNRAYETSSFWTYPCIMPETFCITALRAQLAGAIPIILVGTALAETVPHGYKCTSVRDYFQTVIKAFQDVETISIEDRRKMGEFVLCAFTWKEIASKWKDLFESHLSTPSFNI